MTAYRIYNNESKDTEEKRAIAYEKLQEQALAIGEEIGKLNAQSWDNLDQWIDKNKSMKIEVVDGDSVRIEYFKNTDEWGAFVRNWVDFVVLRNKQIVQLYPTHIEFPNRQAFRLLSEDWTMILDAPYTTAQQRVVTALLENPTASGGELSQILGVARENVNQHIRNICAIHGIEGDNKRRQLIEVLQFDRDIRMIERLSLDDVFRLMQECCNELLTRPDFDYQKVKYEYTIVSEGINCMKSSYVLTKGEYHE